MKFLQFIWLWLLPLFLFGQNFGQVDLTAYFNNFDSSRYDTVQVLGKFSLERELGYPSGDYLKQMDRQMAKFNRQFGKENIVYLVVAYSNCVGWKNGEPAGGQQDIALNQRFALKIKFDLSVFGCQAEAAGYRLLTDSTGADIYVVVKPQVKSVTIMQPKPVQVFFKVHQLNLLSGQTFDLAGLAQVKMSDSSLTLASLVNSVKFKTQNSQLVSFDSAGLLQAQQAGQTYVYAVLNGQTNDSILIEIKSFYARPVITRAPLKFPPRWQACGFIAKHGRTGVGAILKFPSGWLLNADYSYANWNFTLYYEQAWNIRLGHQLTSKFGELYMTAGIGRGQQLDNSWTAQWATIGLLYNLHLGKKVYFILGADAQYKFIHQSAKLGPLEFYQSADDPQTLYYRQPILQPEKKFYRSDGCVWLGLGFEL